MSGKQCTFDEPLSKSQDPVTSYEAAESFGRSGRAESQRSVVLRYLRMYGPATSAELGRLMGGDRYKCHRRLPELVEQGLAERIGYRRCKVVRKRCLVWRATLTEASLFSKPVNQDRAPSR